MFCTDILPLLSRPEQPVGIEILSEHLGLNDFGGPGRKITRKSPRYFSVRLHFLGGHNAAASDNAQNAPWS